MLFALQIILVAVWLASYGGLLRAESVQLKPQELPWAIKSVAYRVFLFAETTGRCPSADVALTVAGGNLPPGLELYGFELEGTPREMGRFRFSVRAHNNCGSEIRTFDLFVTGKPILIASPRAVTFRFHAGGPDPPEEVIRLESGWPELPYLVEISDAPWLRADVAHGITPARGSALTGDTLRLRVDPAKLAPGVYQVDVKFTAWNAVNVELVKVTLHILEN
jgi:hypothetical protein